MANQRPIRLQFNKEIRIPVPWGHLAAKVWGSDDGLPVLGLHGWQDNAGTFDTLAPLLPANIFLVCLDFCGHGLSSPYPHGMFLHYYDHVYHLKLVFDYFKWNKATIIGHSMGALAALFFASAYPELLEKLVSIDIVMQYTFPPASFPARIRGVLTQFQELSLKLESESVVKAMTYEEARDKLVMNYGESIDKKDAEILLIRGLRRKSQDADQWEYTRDLRTIIRPYLFHDCTTEQIKDVARAITCPLLIIKAQRSLSLAAELFGEFYEIYRNASRDFRLVEVDGRHHVHLSKPELVAPLIINFISPLLQSNM